MIDRANVLLDRVDSKDHVIGKIARRDVFDERANFRVVHVVLHNAEGHVLLQKIAPGLRHAGFWGSSAAGYVRAGESYRRAAERTLKAELGLVLELTAHGTTSMIDQGCRKFIGVFTAQYSGMLRFMPEHVSGMEFLAPSEIARTAASDERVLTPTFQKVMRYLRSHGYFGRRA